MAVGVHRARMDMGEPTAEVAGAAMRGTVLARFEEGGEAGGELTILGTGPPMPDQHPGAQSQY